MKESRAGYRKTPHGYELIQTADKRIIDISDCHCNNGSKDSNEGLEMHVNWYNLELQGNGQSDK